ncbi:exported hypothetical protein [Xenorhabdus innexi]|uniref:Uncharacterized protein n=1 Tax=Xenorhabdus innexi TaxID=290109 RepID=A0A1N6MZH5_9GAMM|nr:exported hypothetical protein [Xenorhabdus innexi]
MNISLVGMIGSLGLFGLLTGNDSIKTLPHFMMLLLIPIRK